MEWTIETAEPKKPDYKHVLKLGDRSEIRVENWIGDGNFWIAMLGVSGSIKADDIEDAKQKGLVMVEQRLAEALSEVRRLMGKETDTEACGDIHYADNDSGFFACQCPAGHAGPHVADGTIWGDDGEPL